MRIAINTRFLHHNQLEGIGWFTAEVARQLTKQHPDDTFIFLFDRPYHKSFIFEKNIIPVIVPPPARHPYLWKIWFDIAIPIALKAYKADVFLSPDNFCSLNTNVPQMLVMHDIAWQHFPIKNKPLVQRFYEKNTPLYLQKAQKIITVSEFTKNDLLQHYPSVSAEKITVACNGARPLFRPLSSTEKIAAQNRFSDSTPYFVYVGSIHPRKNVGKLIQAFDAFKSKTNAPHKLVIGGRFLFKNSTELPEFDTVIHQKDIIFTGYLPDEDLAQLVGGAEALAYPSLFEGFGIPILEAMMCDVPCITSNISSMPEVGGDAAILVNPESVESIAEALLRVYTEGGGIFVKKGSIQRQKFSWEHAANIVYDELLKM